ncbi:hypothetical protein O3M35_010663 [Rhynocoris fuscipes]|uniref:Piwi n=1 Tax=Rhynocoris fuscipes TaxID=488301 RepID=A0AAW1CZT5_9HEMI
MAEGGAKEFMGRARGRARGRVDVPKVTTSQKAPSSSEDSPPSQTTKEEAVGRARGKVTASVPIKPSLSTKPGDFSRGGHRKAPFDIVQQQVVTKPPQIISKRGTDGKTVTLTSNYYKVLKQPDYTLYTYRVDYEPEDDRTHVRKALLRQIREHLHPYIFDGSVLFTFNKVKEHEHVVNRPNDEVVKIILKLVGDITYGDIQYLQIMNIILRKCIQSLDYQLVGRNFFNANAKISIEKYKMDIWPGFAASCSQHENDVLVRIDTLFKVMRRYTALDLLVEISSNPGNWQDIYLKTIVGKVVLTTYNNKTYRVDDVDFDVTPECTFIMRGERISYLDYYMKKYNIRIHKLKQPLLVSRPNTKQIRGGSSDLILLIPELCYLTGITDEMRSNFQLMKALDEVTRQPPLTKIQDVKKIMGQFLTKQSVKDELSLWNMKFSQNLVEFTGRILQPELILHGRGKASESPADADFTRNLRGQSLFKAVRLNEWIILYPKRLNNDVRIFTNTLSKAASSFEFHIPPPRYEELPDDRPGTYVQAIERILSRQSPDLIMTIALNNRADRYDAIKKKCYVERGIPSQVVLAKNLNPRGAMSVATKIAIQINCKLGGAPWAVQIPFKKPVMIVGFDVSRDTFVKGRTYGAVVISLDEYYSRYYSSVSVHSSGEELSNDISINLVKAIVHYKQLHGFIPPKIIIYRDGVGDGNIHYVLEHEVKNIEQKLRDVYLGEQIQLAFIVVSKNVPTRIFYNNGNPPPGTVVDDCITQPHKYDFFLVSQSVRQGTVGPTNYNVIYDTTGLSPNIIQRLTYKLTLLYFNWSGTISVPAPVQYAHKLAFMCSQHLHQQPNEALNTYLYFL